MGVDTDAWAPSHNNYKDIDLLIYDKVMWNRESVKPPLLAVINDFSRRRNLQVKSIIYGSYSERGYRDLLGRSKGMIFLCEHESQGLAYQECLSSGVPVLAWDQGQCLDPNRFAWGQPHIAATSVPYFDERCGERFMGHGDLRGRLSTFVENVNASAYRPRDFVMENLTLKGCATRFLSFFE